MDEDTVMSDVEGDEEMQQDGPGEETEVQSTCLSNNLEIKNGSQ